MPRHRRRPIRPSAPAPGAGLTIDRRPGYVTALHRQRRATRDQRNILCTHYQPPAYLMSRIGVAGRRAVYATTDAGVATHHADFRHRYRLLTENGLEFRIFPAHDGLCVQAIYHLPGFAAPTGAPDRRESVLATTTRSWETIFGADLPAHTRIARIRAMRSAADAPKDILLDATWTTQILLTGPTASVHLARPEGSGFAMRIVRIGTRHTQVHLIRHAAAMPAPHETTLWLRAMAAHVNRAHRRLSRARQVRLQMATEIAYLRDGLERLAFAAAGFCRRLLLR